jgi:chorismate mutase
MASLRKAAPPLTSKTKLTDDKNFDLRRRRDQLTARVAELQWDLGGLVYEMAVRDEIRVEVIVKRACGSPHSTGASFCWQCGQPLLAQIASDSIRS